MALHTLALGKKALREAAGSLFSLVSRVVGAGDVEAHDTEAHQVEGGALGDGNLALDDTVGDYVEGGLGYVEGYGASLDQFGSGCGIGGVLVEDCSISLPACR